MTIGIPFQMAFQNSNVVDNVSVLDDILINCQPPIIQPGLEIQSGDWIYEYQGVSFTPKYWEQRDADNGVYQIGDVVLSHCKLVKVTGKYGSGLIKHEQPKEPERYATYDSLIDYNNWDNRYTIIYADIRSNWLTRVWTDGHIQYTILWNSKKNTYQWVIRDTRTDAQGNVAYFDIAHSSVYDGAKDTKAKLIQWGGVGLSRTECIVITSMVLRESEYYLRTHLNRPLEYYTWETGTEYSYSFGDATCPADIEGFSQKRHVQALNPFDGKNYTTAEVATSDAENFVRWDMLTAEAIDSVALGRVVCDTVDFRVSDQNGDTLFELNNYPVDNTINSGRSEIFPSTVILYADQTYPPGSVVTIWLHGPLVSIGEIVGASKLDAGFTKVDFQNKFKDFSPKEQDQWGNWYYDDGIRVQVHTGSVEYKVTNYDKINRLMLLIGGQTVIINSSDSTNNEVPDGRKIFSATMMIARFTSFELTTTEQKKRIGERATYKFTVEEIV